MKKYAANDFIKNNVVCIAGMHRSGTSMVSRLLISCGLYTGPPNKIIPPRPDNLEGFWENIDFVNLNDRILAELGGGWDYFPPSVKEGWENEKSINNYRKIALSIANSFRDEKFWGWKDPRNSLTLPFWLKLLPDMKLIVCLRNPLEVALSLQKRNNSSIPFGINLWEVYNRQLIPYVQSGNIVVTHYDSYFYSAKRELKRILKKLDLNITQNLIFNAVSTVSSSMRHNILSEQELKSSGASNDCLKLYNDLCRNAGQIYNEISTNTFCSVTEGDKSTRTVSIVILAHNQIEYTKKCIESILKYTTINFELILVNNGSTDATKKYFEKILKRYEPGSVKFDSKEKNQEFAQPFNKNIPFNKNLKRLKIITNRENRGFAAGNNQGLEVTQGRYTILLNNDAVVTQGWLESLVACADNHPKAGIIGPRSNHVSGSQIVKVVDYNPESLENLDNFAKMYAKKNYRKASRIMRVVGFCMLIKQQVIEKIGGLDTRFGLGNFEDDDYSLRAALAGFESWIAEDCFIHHFGSKTFSGAKIDFKKSLINNWEIFKNKWGLPDDLPYGSQYTIPQINNNKFNPQIHYIPLSENGDILSPDQLENYSDTVQLEINTILKNIDLLFQKEQVEEGIEAFLNAIQRFPEEHTIYVFMAKQLINYSLYNDALDTLKEIPSNLNSCKTKTEVHKAEISLLKGYCCAGLGKYEEAAKLIDQVAEVQPDHPLAQNLKGILAYRNDDKKQAENLFHRACKVDPDYGEAFTNIGSLKWEAQDTDEALRLFELGFSLTPTDLDIANFYHDAVSALEKYEQAEPVVRKALKQFPKNKKIHYILIDLLIRMDKLVPAMIQIERAVKLFGIKDGILDAALKLRRQIGPIKISKSTKKKTTVSLCMIVKDEQKHLAQCLDSVKPIVDEMIIVDTGSTDRTIDIATVFGAQVFDFEWVDDFAAARNFSISKATGDWILIMDADEVISKRDYGSFRKLTRNKRSRITAYSIITRNYCFKSNIIGWNPNDGYYSDEEAGIGWIPSEKVRVFSNSKKIIFEGAVHEMVDPVLERLSIIILKSKIPVHHYGSLNEGKQDHKGQLYFSIGKKKLLKNECDIGAIKELAIQASVLKKWVDSIELWKKYLAMKPDKKDAAEAYVNMASAYIHTQDYVNALMLAQKAVEASPNSKEAQLNLGMAELFNGNTNSALKTIESLFKNHPNFPPAQFMYGASKCLKSDNTSIKFDMKELKQSFREPVLNYSVLELAEGLMAAEKYNLVKVLLGNAIKEEIVSKEIMNLYLSCLQKIQDTMRLDDVINEEKDDRIESIAHL